MKGLSVCLSVGIDVSLFNWKSFFLFLRFLYSSLSFFLSELEQEWALAGHFRLLQDGENWST